MTMNLEYLATVTRNPKPPMTHARAKLIIWNPKAYEPALVRKAAVWTLGDLNAKQEDIDQASNLL